MSTDMTNWVWCEDCLEWKDAGEEVSLLSIGEGHSGQDVMTFDCDKCGNEHKNFIVVQEDRPLGG